MFQNASRYTIKVVREHGDRLVWDFSNTLVSRQNCDMNGNRSTMGKIECIGFFFIMTYNTTGHHHFLPAHDHEQLLFQEELS